MTSRIRFSAQTPWYELFSRGARDWLRHNEKVREAVRDQLADLLAGGDFISQPDQRTVQVPVRLLEHARFRLADPQKQSGAGQGNAQAGDTLRPADAGDDFRPCLVVAQLVQPGTEDLGLPDFHGLSLTGDNVS